MHDQSRQKLKYLENEKCFWCEIRSIFHHSFLKYFQLPKVFSDLRVHLWPFLSWGNTPAYKFRVYSKSFTSSKCTLKDSFTSAGEIVEQDSEFFMGRLDIDSLLSNILHEEIINISNNTLFENSERVEVFLKMKFMKL